MRGCRAQAPFFVCRYPLIRANGPRSRRLGDFFYPYRDHIGVAAWRPLVWPCQHKQGKHGKRKAILRLPDLEQSRSAILNSLAAREFTTPNRRGPHAGQAHVPEYHPVNSSIRDREDHWTIADLVGTARHIRTIPVTNWVKHAMDDWTIAAHISTGYVFRKVTRPDKVWGERLSAKAIWHVGRRSAPVSIDVQHVMISGALCEVLRHGRRGAGANPVPAWSCVDSDYGAISQLQTEAPRRRE